MLGASAATQSSRCGRMPNEPCRVCATIWVTSSISPKIREGSRILSCMHAGGTRGHLLSWFGCSGFLRFIDRTNHVKTPFRILFELVFQDAFAAIEGIFQAHGFPFDSTELLGSEKGLGEKPFQSSRTRDNLPVFGGKLLQ